MKLAEIFQAREALVRLSQLKIPPQVAYTLLKYLKAVNAEQEIIVQRQNAELCAAVGAKEGDFVSVKGGTPEYAKFIERFGPFLDGESELKPMPMGIERFLEAIGSENGNALSAADLAALEPFFEPAGAEK